MDDLFPDTYRGHGNLGVGEDRGYPDCLDNGGWALRFGRVPGTKRSCLYFDVTVSPLSLGILVGTGATLPAQIATFYASGSQSAFQGSYNLLPDTRRRLIVHNNELYYAYASSSGDFGVAKVAIGGSPTAVVTG